MPASAAAPASGSTPSEFSVKATRWYWPTTMHTSMSCCSSQPGGQRRPGGVADPVVGVELVGGPEQGGVVVRPARRRRGRRGRGRSPPR